MKKTLILLLLGSFSIQLNAMSDEGQRPIKKQKISDFELKEQEETLLEQQFINAINNGNSEEIIIALEKGVNPNTLEIDIFSGDHYSPLISLITTHADIKIIELLIKYPKINLNSIDSTGGTALHWASYQLNLEIIKLLVNFGTNLNIQNCYKSTPLLELINGANDLIDVDVIEYLQAAKLLSNHDNVNIQNNDGNNALMRVISIELSDPNNFRQSDLINHLVDHCNASLTIKNNKGETAIDIAKKFDNKEVIEFLENKLQKVKTFQQQIKNEILATTPLTEDLAKVTSEYLEGSQPIVIQTV